MSVIVGSPNYVVRTRSEADEAAKAKRGAAFYALARAKREAIAVYFADDAGRVAGLAVDPRSAGVDAPLRPTVRNATEYDLREEFPTAYAGAFYRAYDRAVAEERENVRLFGWTYYR